MRVPLIDIFKQGVDMGMNFIEMLAFILGIIAPISLVFLFLFFVILLWGYIKKTKG